VNARAQQKALFFQRVDVAKRETSFFMVGIASPTPDGMLVLDSLLHTWGRNGLGENNIGRFSSAKIDAVLDCRAHGAGARKRVALMEEAQLLQRQDFFYVPIHQQVTPWALRRTSKLAPAGQLS
jgi:peptide/nickel transport system substrate-binding protein